MPQRHCPYCDGRGGKFVKRKTIKDGKIVTSQEWEKCRKCWGSGIQKYP